jgi:uncharacterized protein (TIGR03790 family)
MRSTWPIVLFVSLVASPALAQSGENVLLVANKSSADSVRIAERYARARSVPADQLLRVDVDAAADDVDRDVFDGQIETPIAEWLRRHAAQDRILYLVLAKGIPLRIRGTSGRAGTMASVDSELTLLYRRMTGVTVPLVGPLPNPYFLGDAPVTQAKPFGHEAADIYLVTRLDGYTVDDVLGLIDRGVAPTRDGRILLDEKAALDDPPGNRWLKAAADALDALGLGARTVLDTTSTVLSNQTGVLGYYSWGSNDPGLTVRHLGLGFVPGAIAGMFVSTDGRTFKEPPPAWTPGLWTDPAKVFAGSSQSLAGDLIRDGVTGVSAQVAEPYQDGSVRPNALFPAYVSGFNLAESFYLAIPYLSWQTIVVGDPLCAPFPRKALAPAEIAQGIDPKTELPVLFSGRRQQVLLAKGTRPDAAQAALRAEARTAKDDAAGAEQALEEATALDPRLTDAQITLGTTYDGRHEYDKAIERYRLALSSDPNHIIALNNLAYALAVRKNRAAEAVVYAERAHALSPHSASVADTLAWVYHYLGRDRDAARLLAPVVRVLPGDADVRLHAAVVFAAIGMLDAAATELHEALRLNPALEQSDDVAALRVKLKVPK